MLEKVEFMVKCSDIEVIKLFSCSTQLSMNFQLLIKAKMLINNEFSCCQTLSWCNYPARMIHAFVGRKVRFSRIRVDIQILFFGYQLIL